MNVKDIQAGKLAADPGCHALVYELHQLSGPAVWKEIFRCERPFHVDVGSGRDTLLIEIAKSRPDLSLVGFEYSRERVEKLARKIRRSAVESIRLVRGEALQGIARLFEPQTVESFTLFFPDPWPKKKHQRKRLITPASARLFATRLKPEGLLYFKTDDYSFALQVMQILEKTPFLYNLYGPGVWAPCEGLLQHQSLYERKWLSQGKKVHRLVYVKSDEV